jgi:hypothetical protein
VYSTISTDFSHVDSTKECAASLLFVLLKPDSALENARRFLTSTTINLYSIMSTEETPTEETSTEETFIQDTPTISVRYVHGMATVSINRAFMLKLDPSVQESCQSRITTNFCLCFPFSLGQERIRVKAAHGM